MLFYIKRKRIDFSTNPLIFICLKHTEIIPSKKVRRTEVIPILMKIGWK